MPHHTRTLPELNTVLLSQTEFLKIRLSYWQTFVQYLQINRRVRHEETATFHTDDCLEPEEPVTSVSLARLAHCLTRR